MPKPLVVVFFHKVPSGWRTSANAKPDHYFPRPDSLPLKTMARFYPEWDEEVTESVPESLYMRPEAYLPGPQGLETFGVHFCKECQLTWIAGRAGENEASKHPWHNSHTWGHGEEGSGQKRSLLVFADGCVSLERREGIRAGMGLFWGPESEYNGIKKISSSMMDDKYSNERAELCAARYVLETVRSVILVRRRNIVSSCTGKPVGEDKDKVEFRLIVATLGYVIETMCMRLDRYRVKPGNLLFDQEDQPVRNGHEILTLIDKIFKLQAAWDLAMQSVYQ